MHKREVMVFGICCGYVCLWLAIALAKSDVWQLSQHPLRAYLFSSICTIVVFCFAKVLVSFLVATIKLVYCILHQQKPVLVTSFPFVFVTRKGRWYGSWNPHFSFQSLVNVDGLLPQKPARKIRLWIGVVACVLLYGFCLWFRLYAWLVLVGACLCLSILALNDVYFKNDQVRWFLSRLASSNAQHLHKELKLYIENGLQSQSLQVEDIWLIGYFDVVYGWCFLGEDEALFQKLCDYCQVVNNPLLHVALWDVVGVEYMVSYASNTQEVILAYAHTIFALRSFFFTKKERRNYMSMMQKKPITIRSMFALLPSDFKAH